MAGIKYDQGKPDLSLCPYPALEALAHALGYGCEKYSRYNYCEGFESNRLIAAALRHIHAWNSGEDDDPESGVDHLGHALACLSMLIHCRALGTLTDTRRGK